MTMQAPLPKPKPPFNPAQQDCFGPIINRTDEEVTGLLGTLHRVLDEVGEYDQGDVVTLPWDETKDLLTIAEKLWAFEKGEH